MWFTKLHVQAMFLGPVEWVIADRKIPSCLLDLYNARITTCIDKPIISLSGGVASCRICMHTITTIKHASRGRCIRQFESPPIFEPSNGSVGAPAWDHDETSATTALNRPKNWCSFPVEILRLLMELWLFYKHPRIEKRLRPTIPSPVSPTFVWIQTANFLVGTPDRSFVSTTSHGISIWCAAL